MPLVFGEPMRDLWGLETDMDFLNHGSFGATPLDVLAFQAQCRARMEAQPIRYMIRELPGALRAAAQELATFVGAQREDMVFVPNVTTGMNAVLRSFPLKAGDRVVTISHVYPAVNRTLEYVCRRVGAELVVVSVPFPIDHPDEVVFALKQEVAKGARLAVLDHITSATGLILPIAKMVQLCRENGIPVLVDGAHAPGQVELDLDALGADWYTGNCHKWMLAPKGCAFLWARRDRQEIHPTVISHGYEQGFVSEFDWTGTQDYSAYLSVTEALYFLRFIDPQRVRNRNRGLAQMAAEVLSSAWNTEIPSPTRMRGSMATMELPVKLEPRQDLADRLHDLLWDRHRIEVLVTPFGDRVWLRISAHLYNDLDQYDRLAEAVLQESAAMSNG